MTSLDFALGVGVGLGISAAAFVTAWILLRSQRRWLSRGTRSGEPPPLAVANERTDDPPDGSSPTSKLDGPERPNGTANRPPVPSHSPEPFSEGSVGLPRELPGLAEAPRRTSLEPTIQLSQRVVLHLYRQGVLRPSDVAPRALSQAGMMEGLQVRQGTLAGVLRRLEAAGVVTAETAHVRGGARRVKVYRLTDRGVELARGLRSSSPGPRAGGSVE